MLERGRGFSLTEVIVSLAVLAVLTGALLPMIARSIQVSKEKETKIRLEKLEEGLYAFYRDHGRFPTSNEGLSALLSDPGTSSWQGPYVALTGSVSETIQDAYGGNIGYTVSGETVTLSPERFADVTLTLTSAPIVQAWIDVVHRELAALNDAAEIYRKANGSYPTVVSLIVPSIVGGDYKRDPWGNDYVVDTANQNFFSAGADGSTGTSDDIYPPGISPP